MDNNKCAHLRVNIDTTRPPMTLVELLDMQESLQTDIYGFSFIDLLSDNGRLVEFIKTMNLAIMDEQHEQQDALLEVQRLAYTNLPMEEALVELKFEFIDELHFIMNKFIAFNLMVKQHHALLSHFEETSSVVAYNSHDSLQMLINLNNVSHKLWMRQYNALGGIYGNAVWKHWKKDHYPAQHASIISLEPQYKDHLYDLLILEFSNLFDRCFAFGMTQHEIGAMYVAKNKENIERQKRGY